MEKHLLSPSLERVLSIALERAKGSLQKKLVDLLETVLFAEKSFMRKVTQQQITSVQENVLMSIERMAN